MSDTACRRGASDTSDPYGERGAAATIDEPMKRTLVILNPYSGRGNGLRLEDAIARAMADAGAPFDLVKTERPGHAIALAHEATTAGYAVVAAAGGDGTISEVVNGLMQAHPLEPPAGVLGVLPIGSGNDFATMVGVPLELAAAVKNLCRARTRLVDVGTAAVHEGDRDLFRYFDNNLGVGLEAAVTLESYKIRRLRGTLLYVTAAVRALIHNKSPRMRMRWTTRDGEAGEHDHRTLLISVGNSRRTGGGFYLTPDALLDDRSLDVAVARDVPRPEVLALLPLALVGKHTGHRAVTMLRVDTLHIAVPDGAPVQLDGEVVAERATEVSIGVLPHHLEVIV